MNGIEFAKTNPRRCWVAVDSAPIIYFLADTAPFADRFQPLFQAVEQGRNRIVVISTITLAIVQTALSVHCQSVGFVAYATPHDHLTTVRVEPRHDTPAVGNPKGPIALGGDTLRTMQIPADETKLGQGEAKIF